MNIAKIKQKLPFHHNIPCIFQVDMMKWFIFWHQSSFISGQDIDSSHYVCDVLDYSKGTWRNCDDDTITNYSGYPKNVYDYLSNKNEQKKGEFIMNGSDRIVSMLYIKETFLNPAHTLFVPVNQYPKILKILRGE